MKYNVIALAGYTKQQRVVELPFVNELYRIHATAARKSLHWACSIIKFISLLFRILGNEEYYFIEMYDFELNAVRAFYLLQCMGNQMSEHRVSVGITAMAASTATMFSYG